MKTKAAEAEKPKGRNCGDQTQEDRILTIQF